MGNPNYFKDQNNFDLGFHHLTTDHGLINNTIFGMEEDGYGNLWISTQRGISKYRPENGGFENFDSDSGLDCDEFNENASLSLMNGQLLYGNTLGMLLIKPEKYSSYLFEPPVVFTSFSLFNKEIKTYGEKSPLSKHINYTEEVILKHNQSSFSIEFSALSFFDPEKNRYAYTFEHFDDTWYDVSNQRRATYTNIPPGEYIFKVKAANRDGTWNETPRELRITILHPWWQTFPAYLVYVVLTALVIVVFVRVYKKYHDLQTNLRVEKRVNEIKLQFFTDISHEIRTPLTLILGPLDDIRRAALPLPSNVSHSIDMISRNTKRILLLVNQLLDFRKAQNQKLKLRVQHVEMASFVSTVCQNFQQLALQKDISFSYTEAKTGSRAWIDPEKMDSVLFNILSNAFKFTERGKSISVVLREDADFLVIEVTDEGRGIPKDKLPLLFKRFNTFSANDVSSPSTGIGLAYAYELMKLHHGNIAVESQVGYGSRFSIQIRKGHRHFNKRDIASPGYDRQISEFHSTTNEYCLDVIPDTQLSISSAKSENRNKIVVVEDDVEILNYLISVLSPSFSVHHAMNGRDGIDLIKEINPKVIITDLMMPEMDGLTMTKEIKLDFSVSHIPVIMLTAKSDINDQIMGIDYGAEAYISKPFNAAHLLSVVENMIKQRAIIAEKFRSLAFSSSIEVTNQDEAFIKRVIKRIEENCQDPNFNVQELISHSNLGRTVFFNKVKGLTGLAPVEFIRKIRLDIAKKHLTENRCGVAEAAFLAGFSDVKYFSKSFKKEFGINPSEYRKSACSKD